MNASDRLVIKGMLEYCEKIQNRIDEFHIDENSFIENSALADMLLMPVFQIGELANALSDEYVQSNMGMPWHAIRGFRNVIAHDYAVVDASWAWNTIQIDIPALCDFLQSELESLSDV